MKEEAKDAPKPAANEEIIGLLRTEFALMMNRMKPELEPAVVYSTRPERRNDNP